jgi:hypothetical protein
VKRTVTPEQMVDMLRQQIRATYPDLTVGSKNRMVSIRGAFPVVHEGDVLDRYQVEIEWSASDREVPLLRETGGRIPWIADRHMSQGGIACLFVPEEWLIRPREQRALLNYLNGPVRNYFMWQSLFERGAAPPWPDRSHGVEGLFQAYGDMVGLKNPAAIKLCLEYLAEERVKGHWRCPCGNGRRLRDCHIERMNALKSKVPRYIAKVALKRLLNPLIR